MKDLLVYISEVESTNLWLRENSLSEDYMGVYTFHQTQGRGMGTNAWYSGAGKNLSSSWIFYPKTLLATEAYTLNLCLSLSCMEAIEEILQICHREELKSELRLKWSNDLYVGEKKIGGILIDNKLKGDRIERMVFGLGLNVNEDSFPEYLPNPISLRQWLGTEVDLERVVACLQSHLRKDFNLFESTYSPHSTALFENLKTRYLERLLYYKEKRNYIYRGQLIEASIEDVHPFGYLVLQPVRGKKICCDIKEVKFLLPSR